MARAWRIEYEGALYLVLSRKNEGCNIVVDDKDRNFFLDTVGEMSQRFEVDKSCKNIPIGYFESRYADIFNVADRSADQ